MTKQRAPLTFERALTRIADVLDWPKIAEIAGKDVRTVRNWSDPDTSAGVTLDVALRLDVAYRAAGGEGAPLFQCYGLRLEADTATACADQRDLADTAAIAAKEAGEAISATIVAAQPGATREQRARAQLEIEESVTALQNTLAKLRTQDGCRDVQSPGGETDQNA
jgi:hypothetical protein